VRNWLNIPEVLRCSLNAAAFDLVALPTVVGKRWANDVPHDPYKYGCGLPYLYETSEHGAMKNVEVVWRTLADAALDGQRDWNSISEIADAASVAPSTTHQALGRLVDIGAVRPKSRRGYTVVSPEKLLEAFAAHRNQRADTIVSTTLSAAQELLDNVEVDYALSGGTHLEVRIRQPRANLRRPMGEPRLAGR
jgi:DNA-binding transcriptional regulator YhcF (GntR family)